MFSAVFGSVEQGIIYAIMALGVYLSFRVLDFPDLTVDGSFVTGAGVAATMIIFGYHPVAATAVAIVIGFHCGMRYGPPPYKRENQCTAFRNINDDCPIFYKLTYNGADIPRIPLVVRIYLY